MNFVDHSGPGSLDSGDSMACIERGIEVADELLKVLDADMELSKTSRDAFSKQADALREWKRAASELIDATAGNGEEERGGERED
jgi:hypothetical protein